MEILPKNLQAEKFLCDVMPDYKGYEEPDTMEQTLSQSE